MDTWEKINKSDISNTEHKRGHLHPDLLSPESERPACIQLKYMWIVYRRELHDGGYIFTQNMRS